jgi:CSLREA domain-containing protein
MKNLYRFPLNGFLILTSMMVPRLLWANLPSNASTFIVNTTNDDSDNNVGDGACNTDSGQCTLRAAIQEANSHAATGPDTIAFNIPAGGLHTISPGVPLPTITDSVIIDGYTQPGSIPNTLPDGDNAVLLIELDGTSAGFCASGLIITAGNSTVKGLVVNGFCQSGIQLSSKGNTVQGNIVGTDASGTVDKGNGSGINVFGFGSDNNLIGGLLPEARNLLAGGNYGVVVAAGAGNHILGNFIGTNFDGTAALGSGVGIAINGGSNNTIGGLTGTTPGGSCTGACNLISGNRDRGIQIDGISPATGNLVQGNLIGTDVTGTQNLGNGDEGVLITNKAADNWVGGFNPGEGNIIAYGRGAGVVIHSTAQSGNAIVGNSIFSNARLGIDIGGDFTNGVTPNDLKDVDTGPNDLQNFPLISSAISSGGNVTLQGTFNSTPNATFRLEFFANDACDPSGNGEGKTFLGSIDVTTDGNGDATFTLDLPEPSSKIFTATATDALNNTSEFSPCVEGQKKLPLCGNGFVESGETCDGSDRSGCGVGEVCSDSCQCTNPSVATGTSPNSTGATSESGAALSASGTGCSLISFEGGVIPFERLFFMLFPLLTVFVAFAFLRKRNFR